LWKKRGTGEPADKTIRVVGKRKGGEGGPLVLLLDHEWGCRLLEPMAQKNGGEKVAKDHIGENRCWITAFKRIGWVMREKKGEIGNPACRRKRRM